MTWQYGSFPDDIGPCQQEGSTTCVGDMYFVCRNGRWIPTYEYCQSTPTWPQYGYSPQLWPQYGSDMGPCQREGSTTCIGDRRHYCRNGRWRPTSQYCQSDNTPTWPQYGSDMGPCQREGSTTCIGDMRHYCRNGRWIPTYEYCQSDIYPYD
ncbi:hypothetical protein [Lysinibacillus parviboronicapiens]|uniref:hypothetical protein n=1 Tax=Lysinibacillus parviboronicapiens TaxID=436516 RepID=UPI003391F712